jgi:phosphoenolpyruvate-protein phosphotransferase
MIQLGIQSIQLRGQASNKSEAIKLVASLLVANGNMQVAYSDSMLQREKIANTYLGNGIAIPHGLPKDRELITQTGIAVAQFPEGVEWNSGEIVYLVVGIAARSDEHIELLANLTDVLDDAVTIQRLAKTTNAMDIIDCLTKSRDSNTQVNESNANNNAHVEDFEKCIDVELNSDGGLHARPATAFIEIAKQFQSEVRVRHGSKIANGKSLVSLLKLGANKRVTIRIMVSGHDEDSALKALADAVRLGLEDEAESGHALPVASSQVVLNFSTSPVAGIAGSIGIAIGPIRHFRHEKIVVAVTAQSPEVEEARLNHAIASAKIQLQNLHDEVKERSGAAHAAIFLAHIEFLSDPDLLEAAVCNIKLGHSAGWAWRDSYSKRATEVASLEDALLKERANDISDIGRRVLRLLADALEEAPTAMTEPAILVAEDLSPSDTAKLDPKMVLGICTSAGGPTSHTAIIARSLDIPAIVGAGPAVLNYQDGVIGILDGHTGNLYLNPSEGDLVIARNAQQDQQAQRMAENLACYEPAMTTDGHRVEVVANIGAAAEAEQAVNAGSEGVGLLRTEFLFLQRSEPPSEEEQYKSYCEMTKALNGLPLIIRTLDIGGDKEVPYLSLPSEQNPFLGVRGIRLCLARPDLFKPQLRAIYRAGMTGPVKIMFPMIATVEELLAAKAIAEEIRKEMNANLIEIGIMIEVPSAVLMAPELARHADFFSVGTNDLTQYVLAMDRLHPSLSRQADALHPAVLRMIDLTVKAAKSAGIWVGVCGGIAGDPKGAAILTGLGVTELSMSIPSVAAVKAKVRKMSYTESIALAKQALACSTAAEVRAL